MYGPKIRIMTVLGPSIGERELDMTQGDDITHKIELTPGTYQNKEKGNPSKCKTAIYCSLFTKIYTEHLLYINYFRY